MNIDTFNAAFALAGAALLLFSLAAGFGKDSLVKPGRVALLLSFAALTLYMIMRWREAGRAPFSNLYESLMLFAWCLPAVYGGMLVASKSPWKHLGLVSSVVIVVILALASLMDDTISPLMPALQSNWLTVHVFACFVSYAAFAVSFFASAAFLAAAVTGRGKGKSEQLRSLDQTAYQAISFGFPFLTFGIISGAIWANQAWGTYWGWDPKEIWSAITWLVYGAYLHMRLVKGYKDKPAATVSVIGFLCVLFTYFGVSYLLPGLHSYL